jgi:TolB-like protein
MATSLRFDCYEVDPTAGQLFKRGTRIHLREQSFQVLALLLERPGEVVTRDDLRRRLWPTDVFIDFENSLNTAVARLREALGDSAERPRFVETLPRRGYRFLAPVTTSVTAPGPAQAPRPKARLLVLPLVNSGGDPGQEYFSDAMTEEIITELSALAPADLAVIARTTSMHYKGTSKDIARIGRELALDYVVEGSARRVDDQVCLTVQLIRVSDQSHVFGKRYDADLADIFSLQRSVARAVGERIGVCPAVEVRVAEAGRGPRQPRETLRDVAAYNSYIQGRYYLDRPSPENWAKAREYFEAAVARDPKFALAYASLAELFWDQGLFGFMPAKETLATGILHALRAVEIDGSLAEAHALLAQFLKQLDFNWKEVEREMALALALDPSSPVVRMRHAVTGLMPFGRLDEAVADLERALDLDPLALMPRAWLSVMLWLGRQYERGIEHGRMVIELAPTQFFGHFVTGANCREAGMFDEAIAAHRRAVDLSGGLPLAVGWLGLALAESGDTAGARALYDRLRTMPPKAYVAPTSFAWIHLGLGEIDEFFEWMDRAIDARDHMITPIKTYPFLDPIRDDPRYTALLRKMNLA